MNLTAYVEYDPHTQLYVGTVPSIPGAHSQGATFEELKANLVEVIQLCLEEHPELSADLPQVVGLAQISI